MTVQQHELEDVEDLIEDLTVEKRNRGAWVTIFMLATILMFLAVVVVFASMIFALTSVVSDTHGDWMKATTLMLPYVTTVPLFGAALGSLSGWKAQADCQQSLDLAILAARRFSETGRSTTLARRLKLIECAGKEKRRMWRELVGVIIA